MSTITKPAVKPSFYTSLFSEVNRMSNSFRLMNLLKESEGFNSSTISRCAPGVIAYPQLIQNALLAEKTMQAKGLFPCVHAQPTTFTLPMTIENSIEGKWKYFKRLRGREEKYDAPCEEIGKNVDEAFREGFDDASPKVSPFIVSCSYALLGHFQPEESAVWWGFSSMHNKNGKRAAAKMVEQSLRSRGMSERNVSHLMQEAESILDGYAVLKVANFMVIGIPSTLVNRVAYDAQAYGKRSGKKLTPFPLEKGDSHQLRLLMCKETLNPRFGMKVIMANDAEEVKSFSAGIEMSAEESDCIEEWIGSQESFEEIEEARKRKELDFKTQALVNKIREFFRQS